jgi:hypothetical protein
MKVIKADESPTTRYRVLWTREDGTQGSSLRSTREDAEQLVAVRQRGYLSLAPAVEKAEIREEAYEPKSSHVIIVNNGDGEPVVYGRWFTARGANLSAERYARRHPSKIGVIRVCKMLSPSR